MIILSPISVQFHLITNINLWLLTHVHFFPCWSIYRKVPDRPRDPAKWNEIADVVSALSIPVIENGDVFENDDVERIKSATGSWKEFS